ncbi:DUF2742 domain-containing protein [Mycobacterium sp. CVI_P3]|uniref:DUF2742 domain-containing protein n=1 Tax=Mycobacterium pinniadriaticum TaxID=2994102 RepID=A0ABT3SNU2_9MYCO|nr:DUF2742 domain-containing protein [Mycobacterium pinniadriaticum]MCX2934041.1 DUF2742 domain-containing protein [Mycobacterium pinniadriaticum]MCX2940462.1 DUF2742 domain-containing protein [Mycobacterium pinniadriaticum]
MTAIDSQQASWWSVHEFITELVAQYNDLPVAGTPLWCAMPDRDPRKLIALAAAGEHHVLRMETAQEARAEASRAVSSADDWPKIARDLHSRSAFRSTRPWMRRLPTTPPKGPHRD